MLSKKFRNLNNNNSPTKYSSVSNFPYRVVIIILKGFVCLTDESQPISRLCFCFPHFSFMFASPCEIRTQKQIQTSRRGPFAKCRHIHIIAAQNQMPSSELSENESKYTNNGRYKMPEITNVRFEQHIRKHNDAK